MSKKYIIFVNGKNAQVTCQRYNPNSMPSLYNVTTRMKRFNNGGMRGEIDTSSQNHI